MISPDLLAKRPKTGYCLRCGLAFRTIGSSGGRWIAHDPECPRNPDRPRTPREQDAKRAALRHLGAPFPVPDDYFHDPFDCPDPTGDHCENARRQILVRERIGIPGLRPKNEWGDGL